MEHLTIPGLPFEASRIALGTWAIGGWMWGGTEESDAIATIHHALDLGINIIDTAPVYGFGRSEEIVGKALEGRRKKVLIATKAGLDWTGGKIMRNSTSGRLRQELEDSLRRLKTEIIDIYQVHWPDEATAFEETARTLEDFRREGKIRAIGVSNFSPAQMDRILTETTLATIQPPYNLFERDIEKDVLPYAKAHDIVVLAYGALCRGLLSGKIAADTTFDGDDLRNNDPKFQADRRAQYLAAVARLDALAKDKFGKSVLALAVRWILDCGDTIALWGARRPSQLDAVEDVMGWRIDAVTMNEIDRILDETVTDGVGPEFMGPRATLQREPLSASRLDEPADDRERRETRQITHHLHKQLDLDGESDLVRPLGQLFEDLPRAAFLRHHKEFLLRVVGRVEGCVDETRIDQREVDPCSAKFEFQALGEIDHRRLARTVAAILGPTCIAEQRAHNGQLPLASVEH